MHVNLDLVLVEVVDDNNTPCSSGEVGNIVITDFWNRSMPFIRYKLGDIGSLESNCTCGRTFPMLGKVIGRANELVMNKYGIKVPVISLYVSEELAEHVLNFQFKQTKPGHLTMFIVPRKGWNEYVAKERMIKIGRLNGIDFEFEIVDKVTSFPSGKRRLLV
jgi:phenylacetate-CoA ligase